VELKTQAYNNTRSLGLHFVPIKDSVFFKDTSINEIISKMYIATKNHFDFLTGIDSVQYYPDGNENQVEMQFMTGYNYTENGIQKYFVVLQGAIGYFFWHSESKEEFLTLYKTTKGWTLAKRETYNIDEDRDNFSVKTLPDQTIHLEETGAWVTSEYCSQFYSDYQIRNDSLISVRDSSW
jgi:hypothetical protein